MRPLRNRVLEGHMEKAKGGRVRGWEVGGGGEHGGVKMETIILEQQ